jgi:hypothetical protein
VSPVKPAARRATAALLLVPATLTALASCSSSGTATTAATVPARPPAATVPAGTTPATTTPAPSAPARIVIPSIHISASLMRLGLQSDGTVEVPPPDKGMTAGWYTGGPVPGQKGPAVIIGHNSTRYGRAVFHDLKDISKGADITVTDARGESSHFTVTSTESVSKQAFPTQQVYGPTPAHALRLITCDGAFDANGHPVDNLIVFATQN